MFVAGVDDDNGLILVVVDAVVSDMLDGSQDPESMGVGVPVVVDKSSLVSPVG